MSKVVFDVEVDSGNSVKTLGSLKDELEAINAELEQTEVGSKAFTELSDKARATSSEIKTLEKTFEGLEPQQKTEAFVKGFEGIAGAVAVTAGSLQLFGIESDRIGKLEEKGPRCYCDCHWCKVSCRGCSPSKDCSKNHSRESSSSIDKGSDSCSEDI